MRVLVVMISLFSCVISQKNLASNGTASQSTTFFYDTTYFTADLAINGGSTDSFANQGCSITGYEPFQRFAWWMLTFPVDTVYVTNVNIYYRSNTPQNLAGYSLYISNSSTPKTGHLCYHHTGQNVPSPYQNVNCNHFGKNVIFYNERNTTNNPLGTNNYAIVELCYIEVNGCYQGWWGSDCSTPCPINCTDGHCYPGNGSCVWDCKIGQDGDMCENLCDSGTFGFKCANSCYCLNHPCDPSTGTCPPGGCQLGYTGTSCNTECNIGNYGYHCNQSCDGCLSDSCDKEDGVCTNTAGCKPGWQSGNPKCDKGCYKGWWDSDCSTPCAVNCTDGHCFPGNGSCVWDCKIGQDGDMCEKLCDSGTFGLKCANSCHCLNQPCDPITGSCHPGGCLAGYTGTSCNTVTPQSDGQTTKDNTMDIIYAVIGTFIVTTLMCVIMFLVILRYMLRKTDGDAKNQNRRNVRKYANGTFTNSCANIGSINAEGHYEETIPSSQEQTYDTI